MAVDIPATTWRKTSGLNESVSDGPNNIVDTLGNFLVDPSGNQIVDTGIAMPLIPATTWTENDSL